MRKPEELYQFMYELLDSKQFSVHGIPLYGLYNISKSRHTQGFIHLTAYC